MALYWHRLVVWHWPFLVCMVFTSTILRDQMTNYWSKIEPTKKQRFPPLHAIHKIHPYIFCLKKSFMRSLCMR